MCGRFTLTTAPARIESEFGHFLGLPPDLAPRYNIAPTQSIWVLRQNDTSPEYKAVRWGLIPSWAEDEKIGYKLLNARADTVASKPSFRSAFKRRRCLVLADGFYEWKAGPTAKGAKQPYFIHFTDRRPFAIAGIWESWSKGDTAIESCTLITTDANDLMKPLHDRMPVILDQRDHATWMAPNDPAILTEMLQPHSSDAMAATPVSTFVNNPRHEGPDCLQP